MSLVVTSMTTQPVQRFLPALVGSGAHRTSERRALLVDVVGELDGCTLIGRGEASPLPGLALETIDHAFRGFSAFAATLPLALELDETLLATIERHSAALPPSTRAACEAALLDLAAQALGVPLWRVLRAEPAHALPLAAVVDAKGASLNDRLDALAGDGIRTVKCKGVSPTLAQIAARFALRVDLNRAYAPTDFAHVAPGLHALHPSLVEEPVDADLATWLVEVAETLPSLPYGVDESLTARDAASAQRAWQRFRPAVDAGRVAAIVLKPSRDGILGALALGRSAAQLGVPVIVTHFWDGPRAHLAACHVALALSAPDSPAQGLASYADTGGDLAPLLAGGTLAVASTPGLGVVAA